VTHLQARILKVATEHIDEKETTMLIVLRENGELKDEESFAVFTMNQLEPSLDLKILENRRRYL
jgi:hypothetical protein